VWPDRDVLAPGGRALPCAHAVTIPGHRNSWARAAPPPLPVVENP
jgi:hypothetical protein